MLPYVGLAVGVNRRRRDHLVALGANVEPLAEGGPGLNPGHAKYTCQPPEGVSTIGVAATLRARP